MKEYTFAIIALFSASAAFAGSDMDCSDLEALGQDEDKLEQCHAQADSKLNATYKEVRGRHKDNEDMQKALKDMQLGWIKMRDAQCLFKSMNTAGGAALAGVLCEIEMTTKREAELAEL